MAEETVEALELQISANASDAASVIERLSTSVDTFGKNISKYIQDMSSFASALEKIVSSVSNLSGVSGMKNIINAAAAAAKGAKAAAVGKAFKPIIPPTRFSDTVKGETRNVRDSSGRTFRFDQSSNALGRSLNQKYNTGFSNKRLSEDIQEIRNKLLAGATDAAMKQIEEMAQNIVSQARSSSDGGLVEAFNKYFGNGILTLDKKDTQNVISQFGSIKAANEALKNIGVLAQLEGSILDRGASLDEIWSGRSTASGDVDLTRSGDAADDLREMMANLGMAGSSDLGELLRELGNTGDRRHQNWLNENFMGDQNAAQAEVFSELLKSIIGNTPVDASKAAEQTRAELKKAQEAAEEAKRIAQEMDAAWKDQARWNREQDQRYRGQYTSRDVRQQMNLDWKSSEVDDVVDNTAQEVAEWKAAEDEKDRAFMGQLAEGIVQDQTIGPGMNMQDFIDQTTGVSREFKSAAESAEVFRTAIADEVVQNATIPATQSLQDMIEQITGVGRAFKDAAESAGVFNAAVAGEAKPSGETNAEYRARTRNILDDALAQSYRITEAREAAKNDPIALLRSQLSDATPEMLRANVNRFGVEKTQQWYNGMLPDIAKQGVEAGLISQDTADEMLRIAGYMTEVKDGAHQTAEEFLNANNQVDLMNMKLEAVGAQLEGALNSEEQDPAKIARLAEQYNKLSDRIKKVSDASRDANGQSVKLRDVLGALGKRIEKSILGQLARVAKMRALRSVVKWIGTAFKEGIDNIYQWSKALNGHFAGAMDTIASKTMFAKNSIATAFAPAIEALVPIVSRVASWINAASNAIAQFMAKLTGATTWTKAIETVEEWGDTAKKAIGGASKGVKDLLADWDELNIIQSETGGGGGGAGSKTKTDTSKMFEEVSTFDKWTEKFEAIKNIVATIGAGIAGWFAIGEIQGFLDKLGLANSKVDGIFSKIREGVKGAVLLGVSFVLADQAGKTIANEGLSGTAILEALGSAATGALGGWFVGHAFGGTAGGVIGAITGLTIDLLIGINAYYEERDNNAREVVRGMLENKVYKFDVNAVAEEVRVTIANAAAARESVRKSLEQTLTDIEVLKLGVNRDESWNKIYDDLMNDNDGLLANIRKELEADSAVITMYYQLKQKTSNPAEGENGASGTDDEAFKLDLKVNETLQSYYNDLGEKFAECFTEGEVAKLKQGKDEIAMAIINQIAEAQRAAERARGEAELKIGLVEKMSKTDPETVMRNMGKEMEEYEKNLANMQREADKAYLLTQESSLAQLKTLDPESELIEPLEKEIQAAWDRLNANEYEAQVHAEFIIDNANVIKDFIRDNFNISGKTWEQFFSENGGLNSAFGDTLRRFVNGDGQLKNAAGQIYGNVNRMLGLDFGNTLLKDYGVGIDDIFGDQFVEDLTGQILKWGGADENNVRQFLDELGVTKELIDRVLGSTVEETKPEEIKPEEIKPEETIPEETRPRQEIEEEVELDDEPMLEMTKAQIEAAQDYWDSVRELTPDEQELRRDILEELFGDDPAGLERLYDLMESWDPWEEDLPDWWWSEEDNGASVGAGGGGGAPTNWFTGAGDETFEMDASGSGLATDEAVKSLGESVGLDMDASNALMQLATRTLAAIENYSRITAGKNMTVVVSPSSAMGRNGANSGAMYAQVTGDDNP